MSGGAWEYVMGYNTKAGTIGGSSGLTSIYGNFFSNSVWNKYYDRYSSTSDFPNNNRILGDATGEIGPFANATQPNGLIRIRSSWHNDYAYFVMVSHPWFIRGAAWGDGCEAGIFSFNRGTGNVMLSFSFRVVLTF